MLSYLPQWELYLTTTLATAEEVITLSISVFRVAVVYVFSLAANCSRISEGEPYLSTWTLQ